MNHAVSPPRGNQVTRRRWLARWPRYGRAARRVVARQRRRRVGTPLTRRIPSSGEALPVVGLGSWITFNVGNDQRRARRPASRWCAPSSPQAGG